MTKDAIEAAKELLAITQGDLSRIGLIYERLPAIQAVARAYLSAQGEDGLEAKYLRKHAKLVRELGSSSSPGALAAAMERRADLISPPTEEGKERS